MFWWVAAGVLVGAEMFTGTVYLLVIALGAAAGAVAAHLGLNPTLQMTIASAVGMVGVLIWYLWCSRKKPAQLAQLAADAAPNATFNRLDIGGTVLVQTWLRDGTTNVSYRGAVWSAIAADPAAPQQPGRHVVIDIRHNQLVLQAEAPPAPSV
ncbi:MAG: NfeD family protein [Brachymonas sp.]|nr:NfeD family protein [Brachymonas sp.]